MTGLPEESASKEGSFSSVTVPRPWWKRRIVVVGAIAISVLLIIPLFLALIVDNWMGARARSRIFRKPDEVTPRTVAMVLGARVHPDGRLSAMLEDRVLSAVGLYKAGKVKKLLMSGDNANPDYDEVTAMRRVAINEGVPADDVVRDFAGFRTYDSMYRAKELWGITSMTIVTQEFHLPRSVFLAESMGIDADGFVADRRKYTAAGMARSRVREVASRAVAWLDCTIFKPRPHHLGPPEDLSGTRQDEQLAREGKSAQVK
ncbi:MAG: YdcF family protein [Candidatus Sumerlaeaceae bacterium]|nr:YdcF family protein [Candidatus Sumerlaeaceae bacterium]